MASINTCNNKKSTQEYRVYTLLVAMYLCNKTFFLILTLIM